MKTPKTAFTFVELIVSVSIITILSGMGFYSYIWYLSDTRDSSRKADLSQITSALKIYKQKRWYYACPGNYFDISYSWTLVAMQWKLNKNVRLNTLEVLPTDPKINVYYAYSVTSNKQEFELWATLENEDLDLAIIKWNYKSVSVNVLPTILLATWATDWVTAEIKAGTTAWDVHRKLFIYDKQNNNLAYTFTEPYDTFSDSTSFSDLKDTMVTNDTYWQNSDFRSCLEIDEWWKLLIPLSATSFEYQIVTETWSLVNTWCTL